MITAQWMALNDRIDETKLVEQQVRQMKQENV
jgi:hypothetical protein